MKLAFIMYLLLFLLIVSRGSRLAMCYYLFAKLRYLLLQTAVKNEEEEFNTGPLSVLMMSVKNNTQVYANFRYYVLFSEAALEVYSF